MQHSGTLRSWDDARGFGFVAPTQGGRELFVHVSAFPRDGSRPTVGEALLYETELASDGRLQAVRVRRKAMGDPSTYPRDSRPRGERRRSGLMPWMALVLAIALGAFEYSRLQRTPQPQPQREWQLQSQPAAAQRSRSRSRSHHYISPVHMRRTHPLLADDVVYRSEVLPGQLPRP